MYLFIYWKVHELATHKYWLFVDWPYGFLEILSPTCLVVNKMSGGHKGCYPEKYFYFNIIKNFKNIRSCFLFFTKFEECIA